MATLGAWQEIRALRATPTGKAASDVERRQTFTAALRQAEELATASAYAGYAAKPLPLFYVLSQAGRAIAAAYLPDDGWRLHGHGLAVNPVQPVLAATVRPNKSKGNDSFTGVAKAIGSHPLGGTTDLGALWAANPDLGEVQIPASAGFWPRGLHIPLGVQSYPTMPPGMEAPDPETQPIDTGGILSASVDLPSALTGREVTEALKAYPTLRDAFGLAQGPTGAVRAEPEQPVLHDAQPRELLSVGVEVPERTTMADFWARQRALASIVEVDRSQPVYPAPSLIGYALPEVGGALSPSPLLLWWALLLGLSHLARYEPAAWAGALDLEASELAVGLERVLDVAAERVPARVLETLEAAS